MISQTCEARLLCEEDAHRFLVKEKYGQQKYGEIIIWSVTTSLEDLRFQWHGRVGRIIKAGGHENYHRGPQEDLNEEGLHHRVIICGLSNQYEAVVY